MTDIPHPLTDTVSAINAYGYRVTWIYQSKGGWHAQIGPWGQETNGRDRVFGRAATMEAALDEAWIAAQKLLPKVVGTRSTDPVMDAALVADAAKIEALGGDAGPTMDDIFSADVEVAETIDSLEDVLG